MSTTVAWWLFEMVCIALIGISGYEVLWKFPRDRARMRKEEAERRWETERRRTEEQAARLSAQRQRLFDMERELRLIEHQHRMEHAHRAIHGPWHTTRGVVGGAKPEGTVG